MDDENEEKDPEIVALNGSRIAAYYGVSFITIQGFMESITSKTRMKRLLEIISSAYELEAIPIRNHEDQLLSRIYNGLPVKFSSHTNFESPAFKCFVLLQAHFSRLNLPPDLNNDLKFILSKIMKLVYAMIDVISSEGFLNVIDAMDLSQMIVQGMWSSESPLKQIPYFDEDILSKCDELKLETVYDFIAVDDKESIIDDLTEKQQNKAADFVNNYPNLELSYELNLDEPLVENEPKDIVINIERDEELDSPYVTSVSFPFNKSENWWIIVGDQNAKQLYAIKKLTVAKLSQQVKLTFTVPDSGVHDITVWCICDSYIDADKQIIIKGVNVAPESESH
ncbi:unnamed protein product [Ambrosiozyma monospora]|uniref:Unnamed protein product n=1 Tax=Ambrosiozyma monospora TaxID=43982 RepID=A0ACB5SRV3_AMBMO|nr:unnamed protein product [Ambrosiozyma monospora]